MERLRQSPALQAEEQGNLLTLSRGNGIESSLIPWERALSMRIAGSFAAVLPERICRFGPAPSFAATACLA